MSDGWSASPLGDGGLRRPRAVRPGVRSIWHDRDGLGAGQRARFAGDRTTTPCTPDAAQAKTIAFEGDLWTLPYELTITVDPVGGGAVTVYPDKAGYAYGDTVTLTAVDGSAPFSKWTGDFEHTHASVQITMDDDKDITALFAEPEAD